MADVEPNGHVPVRTAQRAWLAVAVFLVAVAAYANILHNAFVFDDIALVVNNDIVKDPSRVRDVVFGNLWGLVGRGSNYYRPLPPLLFMALHAAFGLRPEAFHAASLLLHGAASTLVFLLLAHLLPAGERPGRRLWVAFGAAAVFAVHPLHVEAVAWVSAVMDLACGCFSLLAIYLHVTRDVARRPVAREVGMLVALALALASKEPAAVVPLVIVAHDLLFARGRVTTAAAALRRWGPPFAILGLYMAARASVLGGLAPFGTPSAEPRVVVAMTVIRLVALYVQKLLVPGSLTVVYDLAPVRSFTELAPALGLLVFVGTACALVAARQRVAAFGLVVFALALAPSLYVTALGQELANAFAERYAYLPSAGAVLVLGAAALMAVEHGRATARAVGVAFVAALLAGGWQTWTRNTVWRDSLALWTDCVAKSPRLALAHENLGLALLRAGRQDEGRRALQVAVQLDATLPTRTLDSGIQAAKAGQLLTAILTFQTVVVLDPNLVSGHYNLALAFEQLGWKEQAIQEYRATVGREPDHYDAHNNLAVLYAQMGRMDDAIEHFEAAIGVRPNDPDLHVNLAHAYEVTGRPADAERHLALARLARSIPPR